MSKTLEQIKANLDAPVPRELVRSRYGGKDENGQAFYLDYINVYDYKDLLDHRVGKWEARIVDWKQVSESITCVVRITVHGTDGSLAQDGTGMEMLVGNSYGDPFSNAYAQAFRRACEGHGLSRELWRVDRDEAPQQRMVPAPAPLSADRHQPQQGDVQTTAVVQGLDPVAKTLSDMVTTKQLGMIRAIARERELDADAECTSMMRCRVSELNRRAASQLIDHLQTMPNAPIQQVQASNLPDPRPKPQYDDDIPF